MKVYIGKYPSWFGPYQLAEKLMFWVKKDYFDTPDSVHKFGTWLAEKKDGSNTILYRICQWIDGKRKRKIFVKIDNYDCWSADHTLALIITPVLKKLRENKHGAPYIDDEDVPEELRSTSCRELTEEEKNCGHTDDNHFDRWDYVLDEMIWAFEQHSKGDDWKDQFYSGKHDLRFEMVENTEFSRLVKGPNDTFSIDKEGMKKHEDRMANGRRLFAKYYNCLWD